MRVFDAERSGRGEGRGWGAVRRLIGVGLVGVGLLGAGMARGTPRAEPPAEPARADEGAWDEDLPLAIPEVDLSAGARGEVRASAFPELGVTAHYARWEGRYTSQGIGGRFRWEPLSWLGVEGIAEAVFAESSEGTRIDVPLGSQVYVPYAILPSLRVRGLVGFCAMVSISRGKAANAADADDLQLGVKAGGGLELALGGGWLAYGDLAWQRYLGHGRKMSVWSDALDGSLTPVDHLTVAIGLGVGI